MYFDILLFNCLYLFKNIIIYILYSKYIYCFD
jgi:hypothetical protein